MVLFMTPPFHGYALIPPLLPFGGWTVITPIPCTCTASVLWTYMEPLYLSNVPMTGPMTYIPEVTVPFEYFTLTAPGAPHKGAYVAGVPTCWMYAGYFCYPLEAVGTMAFAGVGLPGGK